MAQTVIGMFDNATDAQDAVEKLVNKGFSRDSIDVTSRNTSTGTPSSTMTGSTDVSGDYNSGSGSTANSYLGRDSDALGTNYTGDDNRSTNYTGDDNRSTNYTSDDNRSTNLSSGYSNEKDEHKGSAIGNFFRSLFGNDDEADTYSNVANKTGSIVTVHAQTSEEAERAADILDDAGAVDVNERAAQYGYNQKGYSGSENVDSDRILSKDTTTSSGTSIPIIEEQLQVGKKMVETGGKRLRSRIIERPVEEDLRLREERVWVERSAVDRPATEADLANFKQKEFELVEHAEVPIVSKEARVVEEVSLGKEVDERVETVRDTVRKTEVDVENIESTNTRKSSGTTDYNASNTGSRNSDDLDR